MSGDAVTLIKDSKGIKGGVNISPASSTDLPL